MGIITVMALETKPPPINSPAQPAGHGLAQHFTIGLDIVGFVAALMRRIGMRLAVTARRDGAYDGCLSQERAG